MYIPWLLFMPFAGMASISVLSFMACTALLVSTDYIAIDSTINFVCFPLSVGDLRQRYHFLFSVCNWVGFICVPLRRCSISFFDSLSFVWKCLTWILSERIALSTRMCAQPSTIRCAAFAFNSIHSNVSFCTSCWSMRLPSAWQSLERVEFVWFPPASPR